MRKITLAMAIGLAVTLAGQRVDAGPVLDGVKARGQVVCGLGAPTAGFMQIDRQGKWAGLAVDICRAVPPPLLADPSKEKYVSLAAAQRFPALQAGEIDLLVSNSTYTLARDAGQGVDFTGIYYYDGQGFLVKRSAAKAIKDLNRANICFQSATTTEANLADYFLSRPEDAL